MITLASVETFFIMAEASDFSSYTWADDGLHRFAGKFSLERLEAKTLAQSMAVGGEMTVRYDVRPVFRRAPDLQTFFELERALSESTRTSINLVL